MSILYEEMGTITAAYAHHVLSSIRDQLYREDAEANAEAFYQQLRDEAAERRRLNPGAYVMPPGQSIQHPPSSWHSVCPYCGRGE